MIESSKPGDSRGTEVADVLETPLVPADTVESTAVVVRRRHTELEDAAQAIRLRIAAVDDQITALRDERTQLVLELAAVWSRD